MEGGPPPETSSGPKPGRKNLLVGLLALGVLVGAIAVPFGSGILFHGGSGPASSVATSPSSVGPPSLCAALTQKQTLANSKAANSSAGTSPAYDEQMILGFEQNYTAINYNVTLRAQNDSFGYGPAYLLNGLTDSGYWYQVGVAWNLGTNSGGQILHGFRFVYEVWNATSQTSIFPPTGGTLATRFNANDRDKVALSLALTQGGEVAMNVFDWNTSARAGGSFYSFGATEFLGFKEKVTAYPTSLITEWYHVLPYHCSSKPVVYSTDVFPLSSAWLRIDEWNLTSSSGSQPLYSRAGEHCCVIDTGSQGVGFGDPQAYQSITGNGTTVYANAQEFVTP